MISRLIVTCEDKEFMKICVIFMIARMSQQYTICGPNEISDYKSLLFSQFVQKYDINFK